MKFELTHLLFSLAALAALGTACGDEDDGTNGGDGTSGTTATGGSGASGATSTGGSSKGGSSTGGAAGRGGANTGGGGGNAGRGGTTNGGTSTGGNAGGAEGGESGSGDGGAGEGGFGNGGEGGGSGEAPAEFAYVSVLLGGVSAFSIDPENGEPRPLGSPVNAGALLYNIAVSGPGRIVYTANNLARRIDVYRLLADGRLPDDESSSTELEGSPIALAVDPAGRFLFTGTSEDTSVHVFEIDPVTGALTDADSPLVIASIPSTIVVDPTGHFVYVTQPLEGGIHGYELDGATGELTELADSPFEPTLIRSGALAFAPNGRFLYGTGLGLSGFTVAANGALTKIDGSPFTTDVFADAFTRNVAVDSEGEFLYTANSFVTQHLRGFAIDPTTGELDEVEGSPWTTSQPYSIAVNPSGRFLYAGSDAGGIRVFSIQRSTGAITEVADSPFDGGGLQPMFAFLTAP